MIRQDLSPALVSPRLRRVKIRVRGRRGGRKAKSRIDTTPVVEGPTRDRRAALGAPHHVRANNPGPPKRAIIDHK